MNHWLPPGPDLRLVREAKLAGLLPPQAGSRLEASGVLAAEDGFYVIFDNNEDVARVGTRLTPEPGANRLFPRPGAGDGFEDIAHDPVGQRYFLLVEAVARDGGLMARVQVRDAGLGYLEDHWLHFPLEQANKGLEGLTCVPRDGVTHLLGLCEGNQCKGGPAGRQPGGGRVQIFTESQRWDHAGTIKLPETLWFQDYSSIAVSGDRVAVLSQESSALWIGEFVPGTWELAGAGRVHRFPRGPDGRVVYCNVEGVSWLGPDQVVVVSDRIKVGAQDLGCRAKDESIHVFTIP